MGVSERRRRFGWGGGRWLLYYRSTRSLASLFVNPLYEIHFDALTTKKGKKHRYIRTMFMRVGHRLEDAFQNRNLKSKPRNKKTFGLNLSRKQGLNVLKVGAIEIGARCVQLVQSLVLDPAGLATVCELKNECSTWTRWFKIPITESYPWVPSFNLAGLIAAQASRIFWLAHSLCAARLDTMSIEPSVFCLTYVYSSGGLGSPLVGLLAAFKAQNALEYRLTESYGSHTHSGGG